MSVGFTNLKKNVISLPRALESRQPKVGRVNDRARARFPAVPPSTAAGAAGIVRRLKTVLRPLGGAAHDSHWQVILCGNGVRLVPPLFVEPQKGKKKQKEKSRSCSGEYVEIVGITRAKESVLHFPRSTTYRTNPNIVRNNIAYIGRAERS